MTQINQSLGAPVNTGHIRMTESDGPLRVAPPPPAISLNFSVPIAFIVGMAVLLVILLITMQRYMLVSDSIKADRNSLAALLMLPEIGQGLRLIFGLM